jgi:predicted phage terminase large subunit-like protein
MSNRARSGRLLQEVRMMHGSKFQVSSEEANLLEELAQARARESFLEFRRYIRPQLIIGWWVREIAQVLQHFYNDFISGKRPKLALEAPPQHGKSWAVTDFISWVAGKNPDKKTIFGSYSDELGVRTNIDLQRIYTGDRFRRVFPLTKISTANVVTISDRWKRNASLIEYIGHDGSFRNTTVAGQINGMELHLGVIDDPLKGRAEAHSPTIRDKTWDWFADDFMSRFAKDGALLVVMTRWHVDDMLGRFIAKFKDEVRVCRYPAIAEHDELHRKKGEALFPEHKPLDFLMERRKLLTEASWESIYQQNPIIVGGGLLPVEKLKVVPMFDRSKVTTTVRYWDKAASDTEDAAFTAGVRMHSMSDGTYIISHIVRGQWTALDREEKIKAWTELDASEFGSYEVYVEQEPGSGGKESAESTIRMLAGYAVYADKVTGAKEVRCEPFAAQVQGGNVWLVAGAWCADFLDECEVFPAGKWKDQVDAAAGAFSKLARSTAYLPYDQWL